MFLFINWLPSHKFVNMFLFEALYIKLNFNSYASFSEICDLIVSSSDTFIGVS